MKILLIVLILSLISAINVLAQVKIFVSEKGQSNSVGTIAKPFNSLDVALKQAQKLVDKDVIIEVREGNYYLEKTIVLNSDELKTKSLTIRAYQNEKVKIIGSKPFQVDWQPFKKNIWQAKINLRESPDRVYLNGKSLRMARYPNFDKSSKPFNGTAEDAIDPNRISFWKNYQNVFVHGLQNYRWGSLHYISKGKDEKGNLILEGGWQINRESSLHKEFRFVENVFEELDAPGEWFYDKETKTLYLIPPVGVDLKKSHITIGTIDQLLVLKGDMQKPLKNISIQKLHFTQTNWTFMKTKEPMLRSDWMLYRGGAVLLEGTENIQISDCIFDEIGGNAIFLSNYNKNDVIKDNHLYNLGASGILFVGNPKVVRSPAFQYGQIFPINEIDFQPGPKINDFPQNCVAEGNLIHHIGLIEKQTAGIDIDMSTNIKVSHNSIYHTPRAGINVGGGTWGGHIIEYNDVFDTVLETGDNGAFNSWGRDRFWQPDREKIEKVVAEKKGIELLDVIKPIIIRNNRFRCDHGWDIDLDDGSTNYEIYNNVLLNGGLKLREGYHRKVFNNILINNTLHPHVWLKNSNDSFENNIVTISYAPILNEHWGKIIDRNYFLSEDGLNYAKQKNLDAKSKTGKPEFTNPKSGNYQIKANSQVFSIGFKNFPMDFGVTSVSLKKLALEPIFPQILTEFSKAKSEVTIWQNAKVKGIETLEEQSAFGLSEAKGILFLEVPSNSLAEKNGLKKGDVLLRLGNAMTNNLFGLMEEFQKIKWQGYSEAIIYRNQKEIKISIKLSE
ncbi:MAG: right-handed parallel beta-helix repeat-containing protein [Pyrinomonadaceae bacterium]|nr:right-handed parallel beta-helix repeat-containing protein [Pyrinomonadaceae bacterium]